MAQGESIITGIIAQSGRIDRALADVSGLTRERIKALIGDARIQLGGQPLSQTTAKAIPGTRFTIHLPAPTPIHAQPQDIALNIAYEDDHLIVVDKPAGLVVHPAAGNLDGTLVNALLHHCSGTLSGIGGAERPGIVHRIDKDTSGLLVVAKSDAAHQGLARQFADHSLERAYMAIVGGRPMPSAGTLRDAIVRSEANRKKMTLIPDDVGRTRGKHVVTHYRTVKLLDSAALVECRLETGRTHQVRVHMASIGHALLGDQTYGKTPKPLRALLDELGFARQALHAAVLGFIHPVSGESLRFTSEMPDDMRELLDALSV